MFEVTWSKILALLLATGYVWYLVSSKTEVFGKIPFLNYAAAAVAVVLIWFPAELAGMAGIRVQGSRMSRTPGCAVAALGWLLLFGFPVAMYLVQK